MLNSYLNNVCRWFPLRHSRFGGSFIVQGLKSIGEKDLIYHRNLNNVSCDLHFNKQTYRLSKRTAYHFTLFLFKVQKLHSRHRKDGKTGS